MTSAKSCNRYWKHADGKHWPTMTTGYAKYIGRVGALAVALGVSGAVATSPGVAWADESSASASSSSTVSESDPSSSAAGSDPSSTSTSLGSSSSSIGPTSTTSSELSTEESGGRADVPGASVSSSETVTTDEAGVIVRFSGGAHTSGTDDAGAAGGDNPPVGASQQDAALAPELERPTASEGATPQLPPDTRGTAPPAPTPTGAPLEKDSDTRQVASPAAADAPAALTEMGATGLQPRSSGDTADQRLATTFTTPQTPAATAPDPTAALVACACKLINQVISVIGDVLGPILTPAGPGTPPESPVMWAVLGWVRRQLTPLFANHTPVPNPMQTTQIEPLGIAEASPEEDVSALAAADHQVDADVAAAQAGLPPEFERTTLVSGLNQPTDFGFLPDERILIAEKDGAIRVYHDGHLHDEPLVVLPTRSDGERGLLGIEVDPDFENNGYVYVSYTSTANHDRLSRITVTGDTADLATEFVLLESDQAGSSIHHGGDVGFGPDGKLYWAMGDNLFTPNAQDLSNIHGKILRLNPDGTAPADNPFVNTPDAIPQIWAYGLRNPFRFTFAPDGTLLVGDVGSASWEELNIVTAGANYGWPLAEGVCDGCSFVNPIYAYPHGAPPARPGAITSVLVYTGSTFGDSYQNKVFIADFTLGWIKELTFDSDFSSFISEKTFDDQAGTTVKLAQGPDGNMYQLTIYPGELSRIALSGGNRAPTAVITATPSNGLPPLSVDFSSAGSSDPDPGTTLTYAWDFGNGTTSTEANPTTVYTNRGTYDVTLTVSDGERTGQATQRVTVGSTAPTAQILTPVNNARYSAGDVISFSGIGSDAQDGTLPDSAYTWRVDFHHADHVHPFRDNIIGPSGSVVIPRDASNIDTTWYRITLTVTDSSGLSSSQSVDINPRLVALTFDTNNPEATFTIDGVPRKGPYTEQAVVGVERVLGAPSPQYVGAGQLEFSHWSNGRPQSHTITTPATDASYSVTYDLIEPEVNDPLPILTQIVRNQISNAQRLLNAFTTSAGVIVSTIAGLPAAVLSAISDAIEDPMRTPAIVTNLARNLVGAGALAAAPVIDAITDVAVTTVTRAVGAAGAVVSNVVPITLAVLRAPLEIGGTVVDRATAFLAEVAELDPVGVIGAFQYGSVAIQGEISHQINTIVSAVNDLTDDVVAALSVPLPPAAPALPIRAPGPVSLVTSADTSSVGSISQRDPVGVSST